MTGATARCKSSSYATLSMRAGRTVEWLAMRARNTVSVPRPQNARSFWTQLHQVPWSSALSPLRCGLHQRLFACAGECDGQAQGGGGEPEWWGRGRTRAHIDFDRRLPANAHSGDSWRIGPRGLKECLVLPAGCRLGGGSSVHAIFKSNHPMTNHTITQQSAIGRLTIVNASRAYTSQSSDRPTAFFQPAYNLSLFAFGIDGRNSRSRAQLVATSSVPFQ